MKHLYAIFLTLLICLHAAAQSADYGKMSMLVRQLTRQQEVQHAQGTKAQTRCKVCAFVRVEGNAEEVLEQYDALFIDQLGAVTLADIPLDRLAALSADSRVKRIEANIGKQLLMDETPAQLSVDKVYGKADLPQAYTGKGVVVGIQDVGFDLTHPNFFEPTTGTYRIKAFWDQLAEQEEGSSLYVGREYSGDAALLDLQHSADGIILTHGTHTAGCAAGSGADTEYRGIAYESDLCLVANAVGDNAKLVPEEDRYKYTYTTDVLGFKYLFDYAESQGKPCVVSFSEGSTQDFRGDDQLFYESLSELVGPGRILVASAGNEGWKKTYLHKTASEASAGCFYRAAGSSGLFSVKTDKDFTLRLKVWSSPTVEIAINSSNVLAGEEQTIQMPLTVGDIEYIVTVRGYNSCYNEADKVFDFTISLPANLGWETPASIVLEGDGANVELFNYTGYLVENELDPTLNKAKSYANVFSPGAAPDVICVGANSYKNQYVNSNGETIVYDRGVDGVIGDYSSNGPTYYGRIKPDVVAPGTNIKSSYSSFFIENTTDAETLASVVKYTPHNILSNTKQYPWAATSGTSMSTPITAGIIALWLEACPTLTPEQVMEVLENTCTHKEEGIEYPNNKWGYGEINAYKGLLEVLQLSNIDGLSQVMPDHLTIRPNKNGQIVLDFQEMVLGPVKLRIYSVDGKLLDQITTIADKEMVVVQPNITLTANHIYAIQVDGGTKGTTGSSLIRF